jgi:hypothetical protein
LSPAGLIPRDERWAAVAGPETAAAARAEIGHQVAERSALPPLVEGLEALGDAVGGGRNLIGVDRVELLLLPGHLEVPENERRAADDRARLSGVVRRRRRGRFARHAGLQPSGLDAVHHLSIVTLI